MKGTEEAPQGRRGAAAKGAAAADKGGDALGDQSSSSTLQPNGNPISRHLEFRLYFPDVLYLHVARWEEAEPSGRGRGCGRPARAGSLAVGGLALLTCSGRITLPLPPRRPGSERGGGGSRCLH